MLVSTNQNKYVHTTANIDTHRQGDLNISQYDARNDRLCGLVVRVLDYRSRGPGFHSRALPEKKSSGSVTGSTQPREYNWGATW
jgi:hypothetical protein